jgi:hypothetical protein
MAVLHGNHWICPEGLNTAGASSRQLIRGFNAVRLDDTPPS